VTNYNRPQMAQLLLSCILLLSLFALSTATTSTVQVSDVEVSPSSSQPTVYKIEGSIRLPRSVKVSSARVLLDGGSYVGLVRHDGSFLLHDIPAGTYVLDVILPEYIFVPIRIDVSARDKGKVRASAMNVHSVAPLQSQSSRQEKLQYPLSLKPDYKADFFMKREVWSVWSLLRQPMVLMMGVTALIVIVFPRMLNSMDPKEMKEMRKMQSKMTLTNILKGDIPK